MNRHEKFVEQYNSNPKKCRLCNKIISFEKRYNDYCSHSCAAAYNNGRRGKNLEAHKCLYCQNIIDKRKSRKFCSHKCSKQYKYNTYIDKWLKEEESGTTKSKLVCSYIKKWLIESRGNKCELCGWNKINPTTKKVPIQIDHIDGKYNNNRQTNLRLLCPCCHSLTPTYGALNKGNGRKHRYE